jgi:uncharacterized protein (TIGR03086 family)
MSDPVALMRQALKEFGARVDRVGEDQWAAPTPCSEWTVGELVDHVTDESLWVAPLLEGHSLDTAAGIVEGAKAGARGDRAALWSIAATDAIRAWGEPGALERSVALSRGPTPVSDYLDEMLMDATVHAWDLGTAIGVTDRLPDDQVAYVLAAVQAFGDLEATGAFGPPQPVGSDACVEDRLVALTGRVPR